MKKLFACCLTALCLGGQPILAQDDPAEPSEPADTVTEILADPGFGTPCLSPECLQGLTRPGVDRMNVIVLSERNCRADLAGCRERPLETSTGWKPWTVVLITSAIAVLAAGSGYLLGRLSE